MPPPVIPSDSSNCAGVSPRRIRTTGGPPRGSGRPLPPARKAFGRALAAGQQADAALDQFLEALSHNPHGLTVHEAIWDLLLGDGLERRAVERYVTHAKAAVFYLDPHVCLRCHYRSTELLWQCPHCHEWNTFVEERIAPVTKDATDL